MVHPYMFTKVVVSNDVKSDKVKNDVKSGARMIDVELDVC